MHKVLGYAIHAIGPLDDADSYVGEVGVEDVGAVIVPKRRLVHERGLSPQDVAEFRDVLRHGQVGDTRLGNP